MKNLLVLVLISASLWFFFKEKVVDNLQNRDGIFYEINEEWPFTGKLVKKYANGQKAVEAGFENGKQNGLTIEWRENGQKESEKYYINGQIADGLYVVRDEYSKKIIEENYKNGIKHSQTAYRQSNGQKEYEIIFKNNKPYKISEWDENGRELIKQ